MLKLENHFLANSATPLVDSTISCGEYTHCTRGIQQQKIHFQVNKNCKIGVILCIVKTIGLPVESHSEGNQHIGPNSETQQHTFKDFI
jgi:hypothetical protein